MAESRTGLGSSTDRVSKAQFIEEAWENNSDFICKTQNSRTWMHSNTCRNGSLGGDVQISLTSEVAQ